jgi:hypothetical protein
METKQHSESLDGEIQFPRIDMPFSRDDIRKLREHILVSTRVFSNEEIESQLDMEFSDTFVGQFVTVQLQNDQKFDALQIAISLEKETLKPMGYPGVIDMSFNDFINNILEVDESRIGIYQARDEGSRKFKSELTSLFKQDIILKELNRELKETLSELKKERPGSSRISKLSQNKFSLERAILVKQAILIAINYP